jgi:uncharacterized protein YraI
MARLIDRLKPGRPTNGFLRLRLAGALLAAATGLIATPGPATAAPGSYISSHTGSANIRTCASTDCYIRAALPNGTGVSINCWRDGQWANGNYWTNRWFSVDFPNSTGIVHASLVAAQTSAPRCPF